MVDLPVGFQDVLLVDVADDHVGNGAQAKSNDLVGNDAGELIDGRAFRSVELDDGADRHQRNGDQDGQQSDKGVGQPLLMNDQFPDAVRLRDLDALRHVGPGRNVLLLRPAFGEKPSDHERCERHHGRPQDHHAQVCAQQQRHRQDAGRGRDHCVGQVQAQLGIGRHGRHGHLLSLCDHVGDGSRQDHGNITENGDRDQECRQGRRQLQVPAPQELDEEVGNGFGCTGILNGHCDGGPQNDRQRDILQGRAETGIDLFQGTCDPHVQDQSRKKCHDEKG